MISDDPIDGEREAVPKSTATTSVFGSAVVGVPASLSGRVRGSLMGGMARLS
jgi:hypothetical protein